MGLGTYPHHLLTNYRGQPSSRGLSPRIWDHIYGSHLTSDGYSMAYFTGDDFRTFGLSTAVSSNVGRYVGDGVQYLSYEDTGGSIAQIATEKFGAITLVTDTTDNDENWLQPGGAASVMAMIASAAANKQKVAFECRVKVSSIADSTINWFVGMSEEGLAAENTVADAGTLASKDLLGFWVAEADGDAIKYGYRKAGQALQTLGTAAVPVADTYVKLGFVHDPGSEVPASKRIKFFVNNVELSAYVTDTLLSASTFPDGEELQPLFGHKNGTTTACTMTMDWWAAATAQAF